MIAEHGLNWFAGELIFAAIMMLLALAYENYRDGKKRKPWK